MTAAREGAAKTARADAAGHLLDVAADLVQYDNAHGTALAAGYLGQLSTARLSILGRLASALVREGLIDVAVAEQRGLFLRLQVASGTGRLTLTAPVAARDDRGRARVLTDPVELLDALDEIGMAVGEPAAWQRLRRDIAESVTGHALALCGAARRAERLRTMGTIDHDRPFASVVAALRKAGHSGSLLVEFEQWVVDGHPLQPVAKIKRGMSVSEVVRYCPEFGATVELRLVAVARQAASGVDGRGAHPVAGVDGADAVLRDAFPTAVAAADAELAAAGCDPKEHVLIPVHPHQCVTVLPALHGDALAGGTIVPLATSLPARPLMSVRTLAVREAAATTGLHVKTALEVQLTGAVRGVSPEAAHNGPRVSVLLAKIAATDLDVATATPDGGPAFAVCRELAGISYVPPEARFPTATAGTEASADSTVARGRSLAAVLREDPENLVADGEIAMPVAALLARSPLTGRTLCADLLTDLHTAAAAGTRMSEHDGVDGTALPSRADVAQDWLRQHVELCVPPILTLLVRYGVALEPHPQNTMVILKNARPHRVLVRDLGGVRVFEPRLARRGLSVELLPGSALRGRDAEALRAKVYFPLFNNHLGELVAALAEGGGCAEDRLWSVVGECVRQTFRRLGTSACCEAEAQDAASDAVALLSAPWRLKTMLAMRLAGLVTDQRYADAPNPLAEARTPAEAADNTAEARTPAEATDNTAEARTPDDDAGGELTEVEQRMFAELRRGDPELARRWLRELPNARLSTAHHALSALLRENGPSVAGRVTALDLPLRPADGPARIPHHVARGLGRTISEQTGRLVRVRLHAERTITAVCSNDTTFGLGQVLGPVLLDDGARATAIVRAEQLLDALAEARTPAEATNNTAEARTPAEATNNTAGHAAGEWALLRAELADSASNLALSRASVARRGEHIRRRAAVLPAGDLLTTLSTGRAPADVILDFDGLCAEGHNLHPCNRVRGGFSPSDSLAYTPECGETVGVELVAVHRDLALSTPDLAGRSVGEVVAEHYPDVLTQAHDGLRGRGHDPRHYEFVPVHPWQARIAVPRDYSAELVSGAVVPVPEARLACRPTVSVRTLVAAAPGRHGRRLTVKTALDVLFTSARRTISPATTRNGPALSALLRRLVAEEPFAAGRVDCVPELAGIAFAPPEGSAAPAARQRGLSALLRDDPSDHLLAGETAFTSCALRVVSPLSGKPLLIELVDAMAARAATSRADAAMTFLEDYAELTLSATLPLMWRYGIALEAHSQNTLLVVRDHRPVRLLLRDFAGARLHRGRMWAAGLDFTPYPGSVGATQDINEVRAKLAHAVVYANLAEVVGALSAACGRSASALWDVVRTAMYRALDSIEPGLAASAAEDLAALLAPTLPQKALATMRLQPAAGDIYRPQPNPLYRPSPAYDNGRRRTVSPGATASNAAADAPFTATETSPAEST